MTTIDHTHHPSLQSWVSAANEETCEFSIQNLPFCVFLAADDRPAIGVGIGDDVLNLCEVTARGVFAELTARIDDITAAAFQAEALNDMMSLGPIQRRTARHAISELLSESCGVLQSNRTLRECALRPQVDVIYLVPARIGDYSDFYASMFHATNVGSMFRPDNPLLPNYKWIPIGYHGRASSIIVSGQPVRRPMGQVSAAPEGPPNITASGMLDYELEVGIWVAQGNELGTRIPIERAADHIFGLSLVNDWSARDLQRWEYQPLGPFLAKSFGTSVAPWVVTAQALAPFRCAAFSRPPEDPRPLPYLDNGSDQEQGGFNITLEVWLSSVSMRAKSIQPIRLSEGTFRDLYWTPAQMIAHHTVNGCNLAPGDLLASGTVSGKDRGARGCLLELTWDGEFGAPVPGSQRTPITLPDGSQRTFLQDGDEVILRGYCDRQGYRRVGLGECRGTILPTEPT